MICVNYIILQAISSWQCRERPEVNAVIHPIVWVVQRNTACKHAMEESRNDQHREQHHTLLNAYLRRQVQITISVGIRWLEDSTAREWHTNTITLWPAHTHKNEHHNSPGTHPRLLRWHLKNDGKDEDEDLKSKNDSTHKSCPKSQVNVPQRSMHAIGVIRSNNDDIRLTFDGMFISHHSKLR